MVTELSPSVRERLQDLQHLGPMTAPPGCRVLSSSHGRPGTGEHIDLSLAVDAEDRVVDARFTSSATGLHLLAWEVMAELCCGISLKQAALITPAQVKRKIAKTYRQSDCHLPFPDAEPFPILTKIANYQAPKPEDTGVGSDNGPAFHELGLFEKVRRIESVLDDHVRPMLATDGGGIELVDLRGDELLVMYQGACGSCSASIGGTLKFIEETLNDALDADLVIKPEGLDESAFIM